jgi:hypothetical protein
MMFNYGGSASPIDPMRMAVGQHNYGYSPLSKLLQNQPQALQQLGMQQQQQPGPDVIGFPGDRGTPFDPSAGIGGFQPDLTPRLFDSSAGIGDFEARQFQPQQPQPQALQQMGMRQQPLPQMSAMQPLLQQFRTQQRPYQSPYQSPFQQRSGQMSPDGTMGGQSNSAYSYNNNSRLNNLAPLNMNALNFSY